jgi:hypothetical protein
MLTYCPFLLFSCVRILCFTWWIVWSAISPDVSIDASLRLWIEDHRCPTPLFSLQGWLRGCARIDVVAHQSDWLSSIPRVYSAVLHRRIKHDSISMSISEFRFLQDALPWYVVTIWANPLSWTDCSFHDFQFISKSSSELCISPTRDVIRSLISFKYKKVWSAEQLRVIKMRSRYCRLVATSATICRTRNDHERMFMQHLDGNEWLWSQRTRMRIISLIYLIILGLKLVVANRHAGACWLLNVCTKMTLSKESNLWGDR